MKKRSNFKSNWPKYLLQWGSLALLVFFLSGLATLIFPKMDAADPEKYCPFGGLEALATYLANDSLPCSMTSMQIVMGIAIAAVAVLVGKLFCGYLCPIGSVEDLLKKLRESIGFKGITVRSSGLADKFLRIIKYALIFVTFYMTMTASELFCKNFDPYYAVATGFKGETVLWMAIVTLCLVIIPGLIVDRFWCKYICPLGAICTSLRFWVWMAVLVCLWWGLNVLGVRIPWIWLLGTMCLLSYLLEILRGRSAAAFGVVINKSKCTRSCHVCQKNCPYNIDVPSFDGKVNSVDCVLCGECVVSCPVKALSFGVRPGIASRNSRFTRFLPAILAVLFVIIAYIAGGRFELPTIDEKWGATENMQLETVRVEGLKSVKCFNSSRAFAARLQKISGVHGVKTYVGSHSAVISFDPTATDADKIQSQIFTPSTFRVNSLDPNAYDSLKCVTIRTEKMPDKLDLNYLGMQMRFSGKRIYGLESMYGCPLIIKVYMAPDEQADEKWFKEIVENKVLEMPLADGRVNVINLGFKFIRMEQGRTMIAVPDYLRMMFDSFEAQYNKKTDPEAAQYWYEIADKNYDDPVVRRGLPYLSNHLSRHDGVLGTCLTLNDDLMPCIRIRYTAPMTESRLYELMAMDTWTISYSKDDVREEAAKMDFENPGVSIPVR